MKSGKDFNTAEPEKTNGWLTTFNDLVTLLMVFFVLVFSMSSIDLNRLKNFQTALQSGLGVLEAGRRVAVSVAENRPPQAVDPRTFDNGVESEGESSNPGDRSVEQALEELHREAGIESSFSREGLSIRTKDGILFDPGEAQMKPQSTPVLHRVADLIRSTSQPVRIEGHTDNVPIQTRRYPSNWELSTARAIAVLRYLIDAEAVSPKRLSAVGYADVKPLLPNDTPAQRALNRRVEILLLTEEKGDYVK
jgi:chemotaxis protein MotB